MKTHGTSRWGSRPASHESGRGHCRGGRAGGGLRLQQLQVHLDHRHHRGADDDRAQHADPGRHQGCEPGGHGAVQAHLRREGRGGHRRLVCAQRVLRRRAAPPRSSAWTSTSVTPSARCSGVPFDFTERLVRQHHPGHGHPIRRVHVLVHRHPGPPAEGRHGHLLLRRHLVLRDQGPERRPGFPRCPVRQERGRREGHHRGHRCLDPVGQVHQGWEVQGQRASSSRTRTGPTWPWPAAGWTWSWPIRRWPRTRSAQSAGQFALAGEPYGTAPYGIVVPKSSDYAGLSNAILGALKVLQGDGIYSKIMTKWGVQSGAITNFQLNGATS